MSIRRLVIPTILLLLALPRAGAAQDPAAFDPGLAGFSVAFRNLVLTHRVMAVFVTPGETVEFRITEPTAGATLTADAGTVAGAGAAHWRWTAPPEPGLVRLTIRHPAAPTAMDLNAFVLVPLNRVENGHLNGYRVGSYPAEPLKGLAIYTAPPGLVEVTPENVDTPVGPHFTLGQFLCKQDGGWPRYLVLRTRLVQKLELILAETNRQGIACSTFAVMSGYRTPWYNKSIGNVKYSRHVWGGAADIYVDVAPADGMMDDLNGDGRHDVHDAAVLYDLIDDLYGQPFYAHLVGGLGRYAKTAAHGPFVHVDVRGFRARWGD